MKYIFVTDMDGSLLNNKSELNNYTIDKINKISELGHLVVLASGRSLMGMVKYYRLLNLKTPIISLNGAFIKYPDGNVKAYYIKPNLVKELYENNSTILKSMMLNEPNNIISFKHNKELEQIFNGDNYDEVTLYDNNKTYDKVLNVICLIDDKDRTKFEAFFDGKEISPRYWGSYNGNAFYDIYQNNISKATAIKEVLNYYNTSTNNLFTFGDGVNDVEMLKLSSNGVAMKNGLDVVKKAATHVTAFDNNNDGIARFIANYLMID